LVELLSLILQTMNRLLVELLSLILQTMNRLLVELLSLILQTINAKDSFSVGKVLRQKR